MPVGDPDAVGELTMVREIEHVPIEALRESEWNPNREDRQTFDALKASIRLNGLVDPLIVRRADNSIIGGHHRLYAVHELMAEGWKLPGGTVPVVMLDVSNEEARRLNLALNKIRGDPDLGKLGIPLRDLRTTGDPDTLTATGYTPHEIDDLVTLLETGRDDLLRAIDDVGDDHPQTAMMHFAFDLSAEDAQVVRSELDRLKQVHNLGEKDSEGRALVKMAERSRALVETDNGTPPGPRNGGRKRRRR
jgi:ParB-like chromosome segregation protein Spo0J